MKSKTKPKRRQKKQAEAEPKEKSFLQTDDPCANNSANNSTDTFSHADDVFPVGVGAGSSER
jgi:hypothetical protein